MPTLAVNNFNIACATLGGFVTLFGLVSYLFKEQFYLSEALISLLAGVIASPHAANLIRPLDYAIGSAEGVETITLYFTRLVLGVQLVLAGVQLPSRYLLSEWRSLSLLLGPGMAAMWLATSLLVWALVPSFGWVQALAVGACVTPTDPVLSNSIVKGKFADRNVPPDLQRIIVAESGANDGLGYPFLFLALYLLQYTGMDGTGQHGGARKAMGLWFGETWGYTILLSVAYGIVVGWLAKELLHWAEKNKYVDRESFLVFAITLALFIVGTCGMIGSDDVLACFIAGNAFTIDDWFRLETLDDTLQPTIDMLLNLAIFMWFGAVCPWSSFLHNDVIPLYRLIPLGILILFLRRIPIILVMHHAIPEIRGLPQAAFVGFFGPIGVSAAFYLYITKQYLAENVSVAAGDKGGTRVRPDARHLAATAEVVVWFLIICSIVVHGLSIPLAKLVLHIPRTLSSVLSVSSGTLVNDIDPIALRASAHAVLPLVTLDRDDSRPGLRLPLARQPRSQSRSPAPMTFRLRSASAQAGPVMNKENDDGGDGETDLGTTQMAMTGDNAGTDTRVYGHDSVDAEARLEADVGPGLGVGKGGHGNGTGQGHEREYTSDCVQADNTGADVGSCVDARTTGIEAEMERVPRRRNSIDVICEYRDEYRKEL